MDNSVKDCTECANVACKEYLKQGIIPYFGGSLCKPVKKE